MARLNKGILGAFHGKVGTVIGAVLNGVPYMRSAPVEGTRSPSTNPDEIANRQKFGVAQTFLQPVIDVVREGFKSELLGRGFVSAKSYLLRNSFDGELGNQTINPAKVLLSKGELHLPENMAVGMTTPGELEFTWDAVKKWAADAKDQVMVVAYDIEHGEAVYEITGEFRYKGAETLSLPADTGRTYHLYLAFVSADRKQRSESVYLGEWKN